MHPPSPALDQTSAWLVDLPLVDDFKSATSSLQTRRLILIRVQAQGFAGWGEAAPVPGHTTEDVAGVWTSLRTATTTAGVATSPPPGGMLGAAFSQALTDLAARLAGESLRHRFGGAKSVWASAAIGLDSQAQPDETQLVSAARSGYVHMKLKLAPQTRTEKVAAVVAEYPDVTFGIDGNSSLDLTDHRRFSDLDDLGLAYIEQPGPEHDHEGHRQLRQRMTTPIALDETADSAAAIARIIAEQSADIINLKVGRFGPEGTLDLARRIRRAGLEVRLGGLIESGVGRAHTVAIAGNEVFTATGDIAGSDRYFTDDLVRPQWRLIDGRLGAAEAPGIGVDVDETALGTYAVDSLTVG